MLCSRKPDLSNTVRLKNAPHIPVTLMAAMVLQACASQPAPVESPEPKTVPDAVTLNIPEPAPAADCDCEAWALAQENYFDRGVRALAARDYEQAKTYFERHRASGGSEVQREADVGIAFVTLMSDAIKGGDRDGAAGVDERAEVMILALAAVQTLEGRIQALNALNSALSKDLEKREEALKRLRDLTLGQQEGRR